MRNSRFRINLPLLQNLRSILLIGGSALVGMIVVHFTLPSSIGIDWYITYRPATIAMLSGKSPYIVEPYFSPPWGLLPFIPFTYLSEKWGQDFLFLSGFTAYAYTAWKMGGSKLTVPVFMFSPLVLHALLNGNFEPWAIMGIILPPQIGLFFISLKPQIGVGVALFWLIESFREGGLWRVIRIFGPIIVAFILSLVIYGLWPHRLVGAIEHSQNWIGNFWPYTLPVGLALLGAAIRTRRRSLAVAAGPCLSPYVFFYSWVGPLLAIIDKQIETILAVIGLWLLFLIRSF